jgi:hypothetical protein
MIHEMQEHPLKTFISIFSGMVAGSVDLLNQTVNIKGLSITSLSIEAVFALVISCGKAALIGGSAWAGQTLAVYTRKKILAAWKNYKSKRL